MTEQTCGCSCSHGCEDGVAPPPPGDRVALRVQGLDCAEEVATLRRALADLVPPDDLVFDTISGVMEVPQDTDVDAVIRAVSGTGMTAGLFTGDPPEETWWTRHRLAALSAISGAGVALGFGLHAFLSGVTAAIGSEGTGLAHDVPLVVRAFYVLAILAGVVPVLPMAWFSFRSLRPDMNLLMTLAVAGAVGIGEWFEAATVAFLFALSLALEGWSVGRARRAVERLLSLAPARVRIRRGDRTELVDPATLPVGTTFIVQPGERFGLDGVVVEGCSDVDQAPITGESLPVHKAQGDDVYAGTINGNGLVEVRSTARASDTTLAQIVRMVGEARRDRADVERWVERFARIYTPAIFAAAAAVFVLPPLLLGAGWGDWFYRALVLLVIGCPCALVISTPVAVVSGLAAAARQGVLVKGGRHLEAPARLRVVALDKTGTLTLGRPRVVGVEPVIGHTEDQLLAAAASIERRSAHPIATAIVQAARDRGLDLAEPEDVQIEPGRGTTGRVNGRSYWLGSHRWLDERGLEPPGTCEALRQHENDGRTTVIVGTDDHVCGTILLADRVRPDAAASVAALRRAGIARVVMLTGDNAGTARAVASDVGIDDVRAGLLPADKLAAIDGLEAEHGPVAMIGDGVNDAPALAQSTLGVAMGAMGTDVAVETADVALMTDDLSRLAWLVGHSKRTLAIIRQNTALALGIKALFVVLTFAGAASLWGAIAADMGGSLLVVFNALRLLGRERRSPAPEHVPEGAGAHT